MNFGPPVWGLDARLTTLLYKKLLLRNPGSETRIANLAETLMKGL
jgi:hypothetical protein